MVGGKHVRPIRHRTSTDAIDHTQTCTPIVTCSCINSTESIKGSIHQRWLFNSAQHINLHPQHIPLSVDICNCASHHNLINTTKLTCGDTLYDLNIPWLPWRPTCNQMQCYKLLARSLTLSTTPSSIFTKSHAAQMSQDTMQPKMFNNGKLDMAYMHCIH